MPGASSPRRPERPRRLWTSTETKLALSSGAGLTGLLFGTAFSVSGAFALAACLGASLRMLLGLGPPNASSLSPGRILACLAGGMLIGGVHLAAGTALLCTLRVTFDREQDLVVVRSGWLGLRCRQYFLSSFRCVSILPGSRRLWCWRVHPDYFVVLENATGDTVNVGVVTLSIELAREVAVEIAGSPASKFRPPSDTIPKRTSQSTKRQT